MIHWEPVFFKGQAAAWFISLFLSDRSEWISRIENHCSNCCAGKQLFIGAILGAHFFSSNWPFPVLFSILVHFSPVVANYNYPIQVTCIFFSYRNLKDFYQSFPFLESTGILFALQVVNYELEYNHRYL